MFSVLIKFISFLQVNRLNKKDTRSKEKRKSIFQARENVLLSNLFEWNIPIFIIRFDVQIFP